MRLATKAVLGAALLGIMASGCVVAEDGHIAIRYEFKNTKGPEGFTCAQVGVTRVVVRVTSASSGETFGPVEGPCLDGDQRVVFIDEVPTGGYSITIQFLDSQRNVVAQDDDIFDPNDPNAAVVKCEGLSPDCVLDTLVSVNSTGDFDFGIDYASPGGLNCSPVGESMSNGQRLLVNNAAGQSIPLRIAIPSLTPPEGGEVQPNALMMCIEQGVTQTLVNHFIGYYTMQARGEAKVLPPLVCYDSGPLPFRITSIKLGARTVFTAPLTPAGTGQAPCNAS